ncbi:MAG: AI-2E family transporter [Roseburia sp.]|nr:AI-2E family transporter [Roseburia sp.]MCM1279184.1 AI-2E family transporter [Robinsoniella sp.]
MKYRWDKKYLYWGITAFLTICASILFYYFLFHGTNIKAALSGLASVLMPFIDGLVLAYLLTPVLNTLEKKLFFPLYHHFEIKIGVKEKKRIRIFSIILTMLLFICIIYGFFSMVIPQIIKSLQSIVLQFPVYINNLENWLQGTLANNMRVETFLTDLITKYSGEMEVWLNQKVVPQLNVLIKEISLSVIGVAKFLWNFILGFIISIYVLGSKELFAGQGKKVIYALFNEENANNFIQDIRFVDRTFGGFIIGKITDSILIGMLCFLGMTLIKFPYPALISVIVGITNVIPFFGPYLGAVPSAILILMVNPAQTIYFLLFILVLQQFDGNVLGPKILGNSTGLSSFWVIFSITIFGGFFGILGMAVGVPTFAVIYAALKRYINKLLTKKKMPTDTKEYLLVEEIKDREFILLQDDLEQSSKSATTNELIKNRQPTSAEEKQQKSADKTNRKADNDDNIK